MVAEMYAAGAAAREIHKAVLDRWGEDAAALKTIQGDITHIRSKWQELEQLDAIESARETYVRRNRGLREAAMSGKQLGKDCPECGHTVYFEDPRYLKIAADLDKDAAKLDGVYQERVTITVDSAQDLITQLLNQVDKYCDAATREKILAGFAEIAGDLGVKP